MNNISLDLRLTVGWTRFLHYIGLSAWPLHDLPAEFPGQIAQTGPGDIMEMLLASPRPAAELHHHR